MKSKVIQIFLVLIIIISIVTIISFVSMEANSFKSNVYSSGNVLQLIESGINAFGVLGAGGLIGLGLTTLKNNK